MSYVELRAELQRQLIDTVEVFEAWREANIEKSRRYAGSMRWVKRGGHRYLLRKVGNREHSLGLQSPRTEEACEAFLRGRKQNKDKLAGLAARLDEMAPINKAMGLGRLPRIAARILREIDRRDLLGHQLFVVGTNALFAYEARSGIRIKSELLSTEDVDLMLDARQRLSLVGREVKEVGLLGIIRKLDTSFDLRRRGDYRAVNGDYRAVNRDGYHVDLIRPEVRGVFGDETGDSLSELDEELHGSPIEGLNWLVNAPRFEAVAIADDGYPAPIVCIDPRVFALHKAWMSARLDRDPRKRKRDREQAVTCADIAVTRLGLSFEDVSSLSVLPAEIRAMRNTIFSPNKSRTGDSANDMPNW